MTVTGYSDRINHALAYAAKHHDQQVRRGTRLPYFTQPSNVALILTRYSCGETAVTAGILYDVVQGAVREGWSVGMLEDRVGSKFGPDVLKTLLAVVERKCDDDGVDLSAEDRRNDRIERLEAAPDEARWVAAATELHTASTLLSDLKRTSFPEIVWARVQDGQEGTTRYLDSVVSRFNAVGFRTPIVAELEQVRDGISSFGR